jgi:hypothetical protein
MTALRKEILSLIPREWTPDQADRAFQLFSEIADAIFEVHEDALVALAIAELHAPPDVDDDDDGSLVDDIPW